MSEEDDNFPDLTKPQKTFLGDDMPTNEELSEVMGEPQPPDEFWKMSEALQQHLKNAGEYKMETEFLWAFFQSLGITMEQFEQAAWHAYCEWDL